MKIPIYQVTINDYKFKKIKRISKKVTYSATPKYNIKIPKNYLDKKPNFKKIGFKIDKCLKKHFINKKIALRVLSSKEHKGKSIDDLIKIIKKIGYDRYDKNQKGDRYENIENKKIDFFALDFKVKINEDYFENFLEPFYFWPIAFKKEPIRIDIAIIYDLTKLKIVKHRYKGRENEIKKDAFIFKYPNKKSEAILELIKIL